MPGAHYSIKTFRISEFQRILTLNTSIIEMTSRSLQQQYLRSMAWRVVVLAHSFGGLFMNYLAQKYPERVAGIMNLATGSLRISGGYVLITLDFSHWCNILFLPSLKLTRRKVALFIERYSKTTVWGLLAFSSPTFLINSPTTSDPTLISLPPISLWPTTPTSTNFFLEYSSL